MDPDSTYKIQQCFIMTSPESGLAKWAPELKYVTVTTNKIKRRVSYEGWGSSHWFDYSFINNSDAVFYFLKDKKKSFWLE